MMTSAWKILKISGLFCFSVLFTFPVQSGQRQKAFNEAFVQSQKEQRIIRRERVSKIKDMIEWVREPSSVEITDDMDIEGLAEGGPSDPIFTESGNDYSGLNRFKSEVELEPIDIDFEKESREVRSFQ